MGIFPAKHRHATWLRRTEKSPLDPLKIDVRVPKASGPANGLWRDEVAVVPKEVVRWLTGSDHLGQEPGTLTRLSAFSRTMRNQDIEGLLAQPPRRAGADAWAENRRVNCLFVLGGAAQRGNPHPADLRHLAAPQKVDPAKSIDWRERRTTSSLVKCREVFVIPVAKDHRTAYRVQIARVAEESSFQLRVMFQWTGKHEVARKPQFLRIAINVSSRRFIQMADIREEPHVPTDQNPVQMDAAVQLPMATELEHQSQMTMDIAKDRQVGMTVCHGANL